MKYAVYILLIFYVSKSQAQQFQLIKSIFSTENVNERFGKISTYKNKLFFYEIIDPNTTIVSITEGTSTTTEEIISFENKAIKFIAKIDEQIYVAVEERNLTEFYVLNAISNKMSRLSSAQNVVNSVYFDNRLFYITSDSLHSIDVNSHEMTTIRSKGIIAPHSLSSNEHYLIYAIKDNSGSIQLLKIKESSNESIKVGTLNIDISEYYRISPFSLLDHMACFDILATFNDKEEKFAFYVNLQNDSVKPLCILHPEHLINSATYYYIGKDKIYFNDTYIDSTAFYACDTLGELYKLGSKQGNYTRFVQEIDNNIYCILSFEKENLYQSDGNTEFRKINQFSNYYQNHYIFLDTLWLDISIADSKLYKYSITQNQLIRFNTDKYNIGNPVICFPADNILYIGNRISDTEMELWAYHPSATTTSKGKYMTSAYYYPTIFEEELNLSCQNQLVKLTVVDSNGKVYYTGNYNNLPIQTRSWPDGMYYLTVCDSNKIFTQKAVKLSR